MHVGKHLFRMTNLLLNCRTSLVSMHQQFLKMPPHSSLRNTTFLRCLIGHHLLGKKRFPGITGMETLSYKMGKKVWDEKPNNNRGPKIEFLEEHGLNVDSSPQEWFKAFLPIYDGKTNNPTHPNTPYWTHCWANLQTRKWTCLVLVYKVVSTRPSRHFPISKSKGSLACTYYKA